MEKVCSYREGLHIPYPRIETQMFQLQSFSGASMYGQIKPNKNNNMNRHKW